MSLLDLFNEQQTKQASVAQAGDAELQKQAAEMRELGSNIFLHQLKTAAEEVSGMKGEGDGAMSEQDYKEKRKKELIEKMKKNPDEKKKVEQEVSGS